VVALTAPHWQKNSTKATLPQSNDNENDVPDSIFRHTRNNTINPQGSSKPSCHRSASIEEIIDEEAHLKSTPSQNPHHILKSDDNDDLASCCSKKPTKRTMNDSDGDSGVQVIENIEEDVEAELGMFLDS